MINPHKIFMAIKKTVIWFGITHYGRLLLAALLCVSGVFSENGTIDFLRTDYKIFDYLLAAGVIIIVVEMLWMFIYLILVLINKRKWGQ